MMDSMEISKPRYISVDRYPCLEVFLDGHQNIISAEIKPTVLRHGFIPVEEENVTAGAIVSGVTLQANNDPRLFGLFVGFVLECYHGRFKVGDPVSGIDPAELADLGDRLEPFTSNSAPAWEELTKNL
jgi:hypothetical protein